MKKIIVSLNGILKGAKITERDITTSKRSLFNFNKKKDLYSYEP